MPHNLYLHSSIVQTRKYGDDDASKRSAITFATLDSTVALSSALFINAAILIVAAATFHGTGYDHIADISDAYQMLTPLLGTQLAATMFAVALLFSGQNATITGTLAGQIVMEGFLSIRLRPWLRRLITRLIAIIPAIIVIVLYGERGTGALLILSQVVLSLQLPFAVFPLVQFTQDRTKMGRFVTPMWMRLLAWPVAIVDRGPQRVAAVPDVHRGLVSWLVARRSRFRHSPFVARVSVSSCGVTAGHGTHGSWRPRHTEHQRVPPHPRCHRTLRRRRRDPRSRAPARPADRSTAPAAPRRGRLGGTRLRAAAAARIRGDARRPGYLDGLRQDLQDEGFEVEWQLAMGDPATEIIRVADAR